MAATQTLLARQSEQSQPIQRFDLVPAALITGLTFLALLIHGYHPYAEDGGIYLPGIFKLIHPELYPRWTGFVTAQTRFSLFAPAVAEMVRLTGIDAMAVIFGVYILSIWATLCAGWMIVSRCCESREGCVGAVTVLALCMSAPAAGTSLLLLDPYVTARSISTPCCLFAIAGALEMISEFKRTSRVGFRSIFRCAGPMLVGLAAHPLMGTYAAGCVLLLLCASISRGAFRAAAIGGVGSFAIIAAGIICGLSPAQTATYAAAARSRNYWFLSTWHWYEILGLAAPMLVLWAMATRGAPMLNARARWFAQMAISAGVIGVGVSLMFVRMSAHSYMVAMLQPLRIFQIVYLVLFLLLGAVLATSLLGRDPVRWTAMVVAVGALMFFVQIETFPHSAHVELPWVSPSNDWERGFVWIRENTPASAAFALDSNYISSPGEDSQNFRAVAERSSAPDYTKDGGITAIDPELTAEWMAGQAMQSELASISDQERQARLARSRIEWLVLPEGTWTSFECPYQNRSMKVCRVAGH